jgi:hypothetical protein
MKLVTAKFSATSFYLLSAMWKYFPQYCALKKQCYQISATFRNMLDFHNKRLLTSHLSPKAVTLNFVGCQSLPIQYICSNFHVRGNSNHSLLLTLANIISSGKSGIFRSKFVFVSHKLTTGHRSSVQCYKEFNQDFPGKRAYFNLIL